MKRYRILNCDFDTRANFLNRSTEGWSKEEQEKSQEINKKIQEELINEFGINDKLEKISRFKKIGAKPFSIIAHHKYLLEQIRNSFIQGTFYPALTSTCTLGERILNHLILDLRDEFKEKIESKEVTKHPCEKCDEFKNLKKQNLIKTEFDIFNCKSCSNWNLMINNLFKWDVMNQEVVGLFKKLAKKRNKSIHFNKKTLLNLEKDSFEAIRLLQKIIQNLFPAIFSEYFIPTKGGESFLKKELESKPFFKHYYIPNSNLVSPYHTLEFVSNQFIPKDVKSNNCKEITDDEFIKLREEFLKNGTLPKHS